MNIEKAILTECHKLIHRQQKSVAKNNAHRTRYEKVTGRTGGSPSHLPPYWEASKDFNPFKVRKRASLVASAIDHQLIDGTYRPRPAFVHEKLKPDGSKRPISIFPVADAALGTICFRRIVERNQHRLSPFSYAFRKDIGVHEAIEAVGRELNQRNRFWLVEFDFSKYFDTISHAYILRVLARDFRVTATEQQIIKALLRSRRAFGADNYRDGKFIEMTRGIPQGNSLSLFLANVACHELDLALNRTSARFARYADDILLLCETQASANEVTELVLDHCREAGLSLNFEKSRGVTQFGPEWAAADCDNVGKASIDYLGYAFRYRMTARRASPAITAVRRVSIRSKTAKKIEARISNILYCHLLRHSRNGTTTSKRLDEKAGIDWDVVTCINDLRSYIYGGIPEDDLTQALSDRSVRLHLNRGVFAFYPLVTDVEQLKALDGWLLNSLASAVRERHNLLQGKGLCPPSLSKDTLLEAQWYDATRVKTTKPGQPTTNISNDVRIPSFVRSWKYSRRCLNAFNLADFPFTDVES